MTADADAFIKKLKKIPDIVINNRRAKGPEIAETEGIFIIMFKLLPHPPYSA